MSDIAAFVYLVYYHVDKLVGVAKTLGAAKQLAEKHNRTLEPTPLRWREPEQHGWVLSHGGTAYRIVATPVYS